MIKNQQGFTPVIGLLAVIAVTLIGFTGFYVYNAGKDKNNSAATQTSAEPTANLAQDAADKEKQKEYIFKELGIKIKLNDELADIEYKVDESDAKTITVGTKSVSEALAACNKESAPVLLYAATRTAGQYQQEGGLFELAKQFKDFSIATAIADGGIGAACDPATPQAQLNEIEKKAISVNQSLEAAFKNAEEVSN